VTPSLIIFDCDGVLVDSESLANRVLTQALNEVGLAWSFDEVCRRLIGLSMKRCVELIEVELGQPLPADFLEQLQRETFRSFYDAPLQSIAGVSELIETLTVDFCVASSGEPEKMRTTLGITKLLSHFEGKMFSAVQVARGKPAPDLFLFAAERCGVPASECVVIEDSEPGVLAAVAAGMPVWGYAARGQAEQLRRAGARPFGSMADLPQLLRLGE